MRIILLVMISILMNGIILSQTVSGNVVDKNTNEPIANVKIVNSTNKAIIYTDKNGNFEIEGNKNDEYIFSHSFYKQLITNLTNGTDIILEIEPIGLNEIVVKANPMEDIAHSTIITDDIKKGSQMRNSADLFNDIPGFSIQKRSASAMEPSLRSFKYEQMNIKFDGCTKVINACPNRMDPITAHIIPEEIEKIEVIRGPYTVRFGQSFGGIVNLITGIPSEEDMGLHGNVQAGYDTNGSNKVFRAEMGYATTKYDLLANGEYRDFGNYTDGNGLEVPSGFNTISYSLKSGMNISDNQRLQVDWRQKFGSDILHAGLPMDSPKDNSSVIVLDYKYEFQSQKLQSLTLKTYYSHVDHLMDNHMRPNFAMMDASTPVVSDAYGGKMELKMQANKNLILYAGADLNAEGRDGSRTRIIKKKPDGTDIPEGSRPVFIDSVWQDAHIADIGLFVEGNYRLMSDLFLTAGMRTDFVNSYINAPASGFYKIYRNGFDKTNENTFGGNLSLKWVLENTNIQIAYGLGTRSASMSERYIWHLAVASDGYEYVGNPFLKAEKNNQFEISVNQKISKVNFGASVFYSYIKDYISAVYKDGVGDFAKVFSNPYPYAKQYINVDAEQKGFEAYMNINISDKLSFISNIAYTYAQNITFDEPLAQIAPLTSHLGLKYENTKFWADVRAMLVSKQGRLATSFNETTETPGYNTFDLRLGYKLVRNLVLGAAILNILDEAYYTHLSYTYSNTTSDYLGQRIFEPGRNFSFYLKYNF